MSTPVISNNDLSLESKIKDKKPRAPTLPAKFGKFIQFGFWLMNKINDDPENPVVDEKLFIEKINLYSDIQDQQAFVQGFFDQSKDVAKSIRSNTQQKKKNDIKIAKAAAKAAAKQDKKIRAPRIKKEKKINENNDDTNTNTNTDTNTDTDTDNNNENKKSRGRKPKTKVLTSQDAFVNEMVLLANGETTTLLNDSEVVENKPEVIKQPKGKKVKEVKPTLENNAEPLLKPVKQPKEKKVKESKPAIETSDLENPVKQPNEKKAKESKPKEKKTKDSKSSDKDELTSVSILNLNDKQYLIDDDNLVYDFDNHSLLGKFDPNNLTIVLN
jgi:hypothetical protein